MSAPTAKQLSSRHVRTLRTFRKRVIDMAAQWEDVDQFCLNRLSELVDELEQAAVDITPRRRAQRARPLRHRGRVAALHRTRLPVSVNTGP